MWLVLLFIALPLVEIGLFIQVGGLIGLWPTLALVLLSAVLGTALMRSQGLRAMAEIQRSLSELRDPSRPMAHGALILLAGLLLVIPGFFTDLIGLLLLVPAFRDRALEQMGRRIGARQAHRGPRPREPHRPPYDGGVVDADYVVEPDEVRRPDTAAIPRPGAGQGRQGQGRSRPSGWTQH